MQLSSAIQNLTIRLSKYIITYILYTHVDQNNEGPSYVIAFGDFKGAKLAIKTTEWKIHRKMHKKSLGQIELKNASLALGH